MNVELLWVGVLLVLGQLTITGVRLLARLERWMAGSRWEKEERADRILMASDR